MTLVIDADTSATLTRLELSDVVAAIFLAAVPTTTVTGSTNGVAVIVSVALEFLVRLVPTAVDVLIVVAGLPTQIRLELTEVLDEIPTGIENPVILLCLVFVSTRILISALIR